MLRKLLLTAVCLASIGATAAPKEKTPVWKDPLVNQVNRESRRANFFAFENEDLAKANDKTKSSRYLTMEGKWRFC